MTGPCHRLNGGQDAAIYGENIWFFMPDSYPWKLLMVDQLIYCVEEENG